MRPMLDRIIREWASRPFSYGVADCCQFAADIVRAKRGGDPLARFDYSDQDQARAIIEQYGGLAEAITSELGDPCPVDETTDGDVLLVVMPVYGPSAAVRFKDQAIVKTASGVTNWPLERAIMAWRV